ncbi:(Fe-S)-binding protein [Wenyingzhuangia aestuarii]|uniref:(Fe-S)-binding protein n=1 Tax=Wenyingzhuangia aestuarii TaxID=1647582 RepID=UPI00143AE015|nr:(Fe-S)-binding protein [Wenyingzhuangia aestuarii]NJB83932.1 Fe-S oxidoreductase [Wenyingzhuangia aestuarii]
MSLIVPVIADLFAQGKEPDILFWVGSAGSFDDRAKKITRAFVKILNKANVNFAVLGTEESSSGDAAKRAGNEFLFQMQAITNIEVMNMYNVKKIVTACPHSFNTIKNEYPELGGNYEVFHHTQFIQQLVENGELDLSNAKLDAATITFHDPCYLGRANNEYDAPRFLLKALGGTNLVEMKRSKKDSLCCGAGGAQMFKEPEKGTMDVNDLRTQDALETNPNVIATGCPFCNTMLTDGIKNKKKEAEVQVKDVAELVAEALGL